jgi:hypothetical protein
VAKEIWECKDGDIKPFPGTIEDYKRLLEGQIEE